MTICNKRSGCTSQKKKKKICNLIEEIYVDLIRNYLLHIYQCLTFLLDESFIKYRVSCQSCQVKKKQHCPDTLYKGFNKNCVCLFSGKAKVLSKKKRNRFLPTTSSAKYGCCLNIQKVHSMRES